MQDVLDPDINAATIRLLTRLGCEVVVAPGSGCCGALTHHLGKGRPARASARANIAAWTREIEGGGLDAIVVNASGCGTMVKDYGHLLRNDGEWAARAAAVSARTRDVAELLADLDVAAARRLDASPAAIKVAYHAACSLQHGQGVTDQPPALLKTNRLRGGGDRRGAPVLRLGGQLQPAAAGAGAAPARAQGGAYRRQRGRRRGRRQHRLHRPARGRDRGSGAAPRSSCSTGPPAARGPRRCRFEAMAKRPGDGAMRTAAKRSPPSSWR